LRVWLKTLIQPAKRATRGCDWARLMWIRCDRCGTERSFSWGHNKARTRDVHYCGPRCVALATSAASWTEAGRVAASVRTSARNRMRWSLPLERALQSVRVRETHKDPELKARRYAAIKMAKSTPEYRSKQSRISSAFASTVCDTKKRNGQFRTSAPELDFVRHLRLLLGDDVVAHQPPNVGTFDLDVLIHLSRDVYVQFDGIYYHGLDRPYVELSATQRRKYDRDRRADAWCRQNSIVLLRVTDAEWLALKTADEKLSFIRRLLRRYTK
jgi:hypothetical protein